jgi:hypothetical protein
MVVANTKEARAGLVHGKRAEMFQLFSGQKNCIVRAFRNKMSPAMYPTRGVRERRVGGWTVAMIFAPKLLQAHVRFVRRWLNAIGSSGYGSKKRYSVESTTGRDSGCVQFLA